MNSQLPECPRGSGLLLGRWVRVVRRSLTVANGDSTTLSPRGASVNDRFWCSARTQFSRALLRSDNGEGGPALLDLSTAAVGADNPAFLIVDERQNLRECFLADVAEELVVGHMDLPRLACSKYCRPAERALPPLRMRQALLRRVYPELWRTEY